MTINPVLLQGYGLVSLLRIVPLDRLETVLTELERSQQSARVLGIVDNNPRILLLRQPARALNEGWARMYLARRPSLAQTADGYADIAGTISANLASAFQENKGFAIANAVVNTAAGITKAFSDPKLLLPADFAVAASIAAAGAAQIATISSAKMGSSKRPSVVGGSGKAASSGASGGSGGNSSSGSSLVQDRAVHINLQGGGRYTRGEVLSIISA
jgi:hypothetical protein